MSQLHAYRSAAVIKMQSKNHRITRSYMVAQSTSFLYVLIHLIKYTIAQLKKSYMYLK